MHIESLTMESARSLLPAREPFGHKGTFGKVLLLCGSKGYTGAAWFASMGTLRTGTGLVYLGVPESIYAIEAVKLNEPVLFPLSDEDGKLSEKALPEILERLTNMNAVLIGCGLGQSPGTEAVVQAVLQQAHCPVVLDADGINVMTRHKDILRRRAEPTILTPHYGEFLRIGGIPGKNAMEAAARLARDLHSIVLLKGHETCITNGRIGYVNHTGNSGMAKGGSGDILAGIILGLLGQGLAPLEAAACGAFFHGAAGDIAAGEFSEYGMLPTDLLNALPRLFKQDGM